MATSDTIKTSNAVLSITAVAAGVLFTAIIGFIIDIRSDIAGMQSRLEERTNATVAEQRRLKDSLDRDKQRLHELTISVSEYRKSIDSLQELWNSVETNLKNIAGIQPYIDNLRPLFQDMINLREQVSAMMAQLNQVISQVNNLKVREGQMLANMALLKDVSDKLERLSITVHDLKRPPTRYPERQSGPH